MHTFSLVNNSSFIHWTANISVQFSSGVCHGAGILETTDASKLYQEICVRKDQNNVFRYPVQFDGGNGGGGGRQHHRRLSPPEHYTDVLPNSTLPSRERQVGRASEALVTQLRDLHILRHTDQSPWMITVQYSPWSCSSTTQDKHDHLAVFYPSRVCLMFT